MGTFLPASTATNPQSRVNGRRLPIALAAAAALVLTGAGIGGIAAVRHHGGSAAALVAPAVLSAPVATINSDAATTAKGSLPVHGSRTGSVEPWTVSLVSSQAQANTLQQALDEAEVVRAQAGAGPLHSSIVVATSEADASRARGIVADQNSLLASLGLAEINVSDLRTPAADAAPAIDNCFFVPTTAC